MPIYDPKGTHWARYTTTQHGPMPVKAAAGVKSANARAASSGASNCQFHQAVANPVDKSPRAGPPPLVAAALRAVADGQYLAASSALKMAARESVQKSYGAHLMARLREVFKGKVLIFNEKSENPSNFSAPAASKWREHINTSARFARIL